MQLSAVGAQVTGVIRCTETKPTNHMEPDDRGYDRRMARGWESKSVEAQVEQQHSEPSPQGKPARDAASTARQLERQALELQRERILDERTSSPIRRKALVTALAEIEAKLAAL